MSTAKELVGDEEIRALLTDVHRIAVLGIKTADAAGQPAYYVPEYLLQTGFALVPVPVYYPEATEILGQRVYRRLAEIPGPIDLVSVFRRPQDLAAHLPDLLQHQLPLRRREEAGPRRVERQQRPDLALGAADRHRHAAARDRRRVQRLRPRADRSRSAGARGNGAA